MLNGRNSSARKLDAPGLAQAAVRLLHQVLSMEQPLYREGTVMHQAPPQSPFCEQEEWSSLERATNDEQAGEAAPKWAGLRPELLDSVLDP